MVSWTKEYTKRERDQIHQKLNLLVLSELQSLAWCIPLHGCTTIWAKNIHSISVLLRKKLNWPKQWVHFSGVAPALVDQWCLLHQLDQSTVLLTMMEIKNIYCCHKSKKTEEAWATCRNRSKERNKSLWTSEELFQNTKENSLQNKLHKLHTLHPRKMHLPLSRNNIILRETWLNISKHSTLWTQGTLKWIRLLDMDANERTKINFMINDLT